MGKASRRVRKNDRRNDIAAGTTAPRAVPAPFVVRPFAGLPSECDWVAMREIVPAATATIRLRPEAAQVLGVAAGALPSEVTVTTVLPMAWPALHRADGTRFVALQSVPSSGDASRDVTEVLSALAETPAGGPVTAVKPAVGATARLQDLVDLAAPFEVTVHDGFDYWIAPDVALDAQGKASLHEANEAIIPTVKLASVPSAYWCRVGERTHLRWILPDDEDDATAALARMHAVGGLGGDVGLGSGTRFLGAFRAGGLLAPVWDLDPELEADAYEEALAALASRYGEALAEVSPLSADERRARAGLVSRQLTLR